MKKHPVAMVDRKIVHEVTTTIYERLGFHCEIRSIDEYTDWLLASQLHQARAARILVHGVLAGITIGQRYSPPDSIRCAFCAREKPVARYSCYHCQPWTENDPIYGAMS